MKPRILKKLIKRGVPLVRVLTGEAEFYRAEWKSMGGCTCFISPPCSSCTHEGHPTSQDEDPECWQLVRADRA